MENADQPLVGNDPDQALETSAGPGAQSAPAWPPRNPNPPKLPYMEEREVPLSVDEEGVAPPEPEFTKSRLDPVKERAREKTGETPSVVVFDPKNPSGRTRGDTVLRPTDEDREVRLRTKRKDAMVTGALLVGFMALLLGRPDLFEFVLVLGVGGAAGALAWELGDSEVAWTVSIALTAVPLCWSKPVAAMALAMGFLGMMGWLCGFTRDANMK